MTGPDGAIPSDLIRLIAHFRVDASYPAAAATCRVVRQCTISVYGHCRDGRRMSEQHSHSEVGYHRPASSKLPTGFWRLDCNAIASSAARLSFDVNLRLVFSTGLLQSIRNRAPP